MTETLPRTAEARETRMTRLAGWSQRHHWWAIGLWLVALVAITAGSVSVGDDYRNDNSLPGTESQELLDAFEEHSPTQENDSLTIVIQAADGIAVAAEVDDLVDAVGELEGVAAVQAPGPPGSISEDGTIGLAQVQLDEVSGENDPDDVRAVIDTAQEFEGDGLRVELSGDAVREAQESEAGGGAEGAGMLAALIILLFLFGSLLAASLPLIAAIFAVGTTFGVVSLASHVVTIPDYTPPVLMLVGLGVGIDYALIIFARYRSELVAGTERGTAARTALDTAGRSVLFAGIIVMIALLGLYLLGLGALQGVALGVSLTVLMTMLASLTLLPSLLTIFGARIERSVSKHAAKAKREPGRHWRRWADVVQRRPWPALVVALAALTLLALPALGIRLGFADAGNDDPSTTSRQAYELTEQGFGAGANGPLIVATVGSEAEAQAAYATVRETDGVAFVTPPEPSPDGEMFTSLAFPETSPQSEETEDLVHSLRDDLGDAHLVGGSTAAAIDFSEAVSDRMLLFMGAVVGLSALLLLLVFGSVVVAVKAAILNLISIGASLGVMKLVFQDGRLWAEAGPIEAFVPVMIFAIVFGLSMDYEVFLISRMHEEWKRTGDALVAVREGLAHTGGVITAAAAIMIVVFGAFILSPDRMLQQMGLGMATAVLLDALVIRCLVVPAVMRIFGVRAGWGPRGLPRVRVE